jgi:hypothetical protein
LLALVALALCLAIVPAAHAQTTPPTAHQPVNSPGPLLWTAPAGVDAQPIDSIACPSAALCVAVDRDGDALWSTHPANGTGAWHRIDIDGGNDLTGIACPSTSLCVAVDQVGNVITTTDPAGGAWTLSKVDPSKMQNNTDNAGSILLRGVACPSTALCVAVDSVGNALISTDPTGGLGAWVLDHIDTNTSYGCTGTGLTCQPPLVGISCPSTTLCAAIDFSGNVLTSTDPAGVVPWTSTPTDGSALSSLYGISCPTVGFCETVDGDLGRAITFGAAAPSAQYQRQLPDPLYGIWCQSQTLCVASAQTNSGTSGLLGSYDPAAPGSTWSLSTLGGVNAVACPLPALCIAGDDEGNIAAGLTTRAITGALSTELLSTRHPPTIPALLKAGGEIFTLTSGIAAQAELAWTVPGTAAGSTVTVASASVSYRIPATQRLVLRLTTAGRRLLQAATKRISVTARATFTAGTGSVTLTKKLTFARPPPKTPKKRH